MTVMRVTLPCGGRKSFTLGSLGEGDVLTVTRLDRLPRFTRQLLNMPASIAKQGAGFRSLGNT